MRMVWGIIAWAIATLFVVYAFSLNTAAAVFSGAVQHSLHISKVQTSYAVGAFIVGFALMQIPAGYLLDKYKARYIVSFGILLLAIGNVLTSMSNNLIFFSLSNLIQGAGASFSFIAAGILIGQWFKPSLFPVLFGLTQTMSCIFAGAIHYALAAALHSHSWNHIYLTLSVVGGVIFVLSILFVRNPPDLQRAEGLGLWKAVKRVCDNKQLWLCTIAAATSFGILLAYASFWYMNVQHHYNVSKEQSMLISGIMFVGVGIGTPLLGWISNIFKSRTMILHTCLALGVMFLLAGIYMPHFDFESLAIIKTISFFIGFFLSGSMLFYTVVSEMMPDEVRGVALSVVNTAVFLFNTLMLFLPYAFVTSTSFLTTLWILPFCVMISILLLYFVKETYSA